MDPIVLHRGEFGWLSIREVVGGLVTHAHRHLHLIMWLDGKTGEMVIGDDRIVPCRDMAIGVNSYQPHNHVMPEGQCGLYLALYLDPDWLRQHRGLAQGSVVFDNPSIPLPAEVHDLARNLVDELIGGEGIEHIQATEVIAFLDQLLDAAEVDCDHLCQSLKASDFRIRKAIEVMRANLTSRMSFDEVARSAGISRPHFFALFKEHLNVTPNIYWNMLRIEEALRQLQCGEDRLNEIALDLGFSAQGNFSRFFREHVGVPPAAYRSASKVSGTKLH